VTQPLLQAIDFSLELRDALQLNVARLLQL
jgi:hypothetical protein